MTTPIATYRIQLRPGFGFHEVAELADYLARLGVSHLYASPVLQAAPGSTHGYDVVDHARVNEELGGASGHARMCDALHDAGLGQVLDLVPNHMAVNTPANRWWWDVLENGPSSVYAPWFDVDWEPPEEKLRGQVLLPVLPDHYGRVLEDGGLRLARDRAALTVRHAELSYPLSPRSLGMLLERAAARRPSPSPSLSALARSFGELPPAAATDPDSRRRRARELDGLRRRLERMLARDPALVGTLDEVLDEVNADADLLDTVLAEQNYRLAFWRTGNRELDYRRFFDVDGLAGLRVELPEVFDAVHARVLEWVRTGVLDGLRIDHPDGLRRPRLYFERLRAETPGCWLLVEKILEPGEGLRVSWPVDGTTGYDFLNDVGGLFVDPEAEAPLTKLYGSLTGHVAPWPEIVRDRKRRILRDILAADLNRLTHVFVLVCERNRRYRDFTRQELGDALAEVVAAFPVYRTYVEEDGAAEPEDLDVLRRAFDAARAHAPDVDPELFDFLHAILSGERGEPGEAQAALRMRFQQLTGPVMAKAVEDTAFYGWSRFVALNEVGGDPSRFGVAPHTFHERCRRAAERWPRSMLALSTHDTKRSEDVRARLHLLSEIPGAWERTVRRWTGSNARHKAGKQLPDRVTEYFLYQTLVGAWPLPLERARPYMEKVVREAKTHTSWTDPDARYEGALATFIERLYDDDAFQEDLAAFAEPLVGPGRVNALAQKLLQLTAPGVPDVYQGTELWDLSLVDPDNRRPVDFLLRRRALDELEARARSSPEAILEAMDAGLPKMWVVRQALRIRAEQPRAFGDGGCYHPLPVKGEAARHVVVFARSGGAVTLVPRLVLRLEVAGGWKDTGVALPDGRWENRLTGEEVDGGEVAVDTLLARFPVALLARR